MAQLNDFHAHLKALWRSDREDQRDEALVLSVNNGCPADCEQCAIVFCPISHPDHLKATGCPACWNQVLAEEQEQARAEAS